MSVPSCAMGCVEAASAHLRPSGVASGLPPAGAAAAIAAVAAVGGLVASKAKRAARGSAAAARRPVVAVRSFENERGVTAPLGAKGTRFWDPMGLASDGDAAAFRRRRMSEIKNGRVAMLACLGWIVPEYWRFPGYLSPPQGQVRGRPKRLCRPCQDARGRLGSDRPLRCNP